MKYSKTRSPVTEKYNALITNPGAFPIVFEYGGKAYRGFTGFETVSRTVSDIPNGREDVTILRSPDINADFRLVTRLYPEENACEYAVYIENHSEENTRVFRNIEFEVCFEGEFPCLSGLEGDGGVSWYKAYEKDLTECKYSSVELLSTSGRPTHHVFPYYDLSYGSADRSCGTFIAVGWPGTWHSSFRTEGNTVRVTAGQNEIETYIAPGETLRTPLMAFVDYENTPQEEHSNIWRHYFIRDVMRRIDGRLPSSMAGFSTMSDGMTTDRVMLMLERYRENGIRPETFWMDAGWYAGASGETVSWPSTGTQTVDTFRFPDKLSSIGRYCRDNGISYLLWFEPENIRLEKETFLRSTPDFREEWLLGKTMTGTWLEGYLLDLGNAEARRWLIGKVSKVIESSGLTIYRQDFNGDPAGAWSAKDGENRRGMTENRYVQGYLAYWDALLEKYPYLAIDSCASGGGRNDLETMKRSVPLHYSDLFDGTGDKNNLDKTRITQSLFAWFPYFKNESYSVSNYTTRINYAPYSLLKMPGVPDSGENWETLRKAYGEYDLVREYFYDDYYQLTTYREEPDRWNGWEFFSGEKGRGFAQLSCNSDCTTLSRTFPLRGLDKEQTYIVKDLDGLVNITATGKELAETGVRITVPQAPYCVILLINKVN